MVVAILRINTFEKHIALKAVEMLRQNQWQFSCHQIRCNITLNFKVKETKLVVSSLLKVLIEICSTVSGFPLCNCISIVYHGSAVAQW